MQTSARPEERQSPNPSPPGHATTAYGPAGPALFRYVVSIAVLVTVALRQRPGRLADDALVALANDPLRAVSDALRVWSESNGFGSFVARPEALWPSGPFFLLCHVSGAPVWLAQRLWMALLLTVAFAGVVALLRALHVGPSGSRLLAGLAYALSPYATGLLVGGSGTLLALALLPWIVVPLVGRDAVDRPWRAAALSGLAVATAGGASPAAALAVLPLATLVLLRRRPPRRRLMLRWQVAVALGSLWWLLPAVLQVTLADRTDPLPVDGTRGMPGWLSQLAGAAVWHPGADSTASPWSRGDGSFVTPLWQAVAAVLLTVCGLVGLLALRRRQRVTWLLAVLLGAVLAPVTAALLDQWPQVQSPDGTVGWAARGISPAEPVLRLAVVVGLAALSGSVVGLARRVWPDLSRSTVRGVVTSVVAVLVIATALPALMGRLVPLSAPTGVESWWRAAAAWLDQPGREGRRLVLPAAESGRDTLHAHALTLTDADWWVARDQQGSGSEATTRLVDAVQRVLSTGATSPGLPAYLARAGVRYVVVVSDQSSALRRATRPMAVRSALQASGFRPVAAFGRVSARASQDFDVDRPVRPLEIWENPQAPVRAVAYDRRGLARLVGTTDSLLGLSDTGQLADRPFVVAGEQFDASARPLAQVTTDTPRLRRTDLRRAYDNTSATTVARTALRSIAPATGLVSVRYDGVANVRASSSASDGDAVVRHRPAAEPFAALDGNRFSAWLSGGSEVTGQWWRVDFRAPQDVSGARAFIVDNAFVGPRISVVQVRTDRGVVTREVLPGGEVFLDPPSGSASWMKLTFGTDRPAAAGESVGLAEVDIPGLHATRGLDVPEAPATRDGSQVLARSWSFRRDPGSQASCLSVVGGSICSATLPLPGEDIGGIDRTFTVPSAARVVLRGTTRPVAGQGLDGLIARLSGSLHAAASSTFVPDPAVRAAAAVDGNPGSTWVAARGDKKPTLRLSWTGRRTLDSIAVTTNGPTLASRPTALRLRTRSGERTVTLDASGAATFGPLTGRELSVELLSWAAVTTIDRTTGALINVPPGVSDLRVGGLEGLDASLPPGRQLTTGCGAGPVVTLDGTSLPTRVRGTAAQLIAMRDLVWEVCPTGSRTLSAGRHRLVVAGGFLWDPQAVAVAESRDLGAFLPETDRLSDIRRDGAVATGTVVPGRAAILTLDSAFSRARRAVVGGQTLEPMRIDGWRQAWLLPAGATGSLRVDVPAERLYRGMLVAGAGAVTLLLLIVVAPTLRRVRRRDRSMAGRSTQ